MLNVPRLKNNQSHGTPMTNSHGSVKRYKQSNTDCSNNAQRPRRWSINAVETRGHIPSVTLNTPRRCSSLQWIPTIINPCSSGSSLKWIPIHLCLGLNGPPFIWAYTKKNPVRADKSPLQHLFITQQLPTVIHVSFLQSLQKRTCSHVKAALTRKCTLWRCKSTPTPKAKLLWMTSHYGPTVVRSVTEIPFHVFIW